MTKSVEEKPARGGARVGAGRKSSVEGKTVLVSAGIPSTIYEQLDALMQAKGWNKSRAVVEAVKLLIRSEARKAGKERNKPDNQ